MTRKRLLLVVIAVAGAACLLAGCAARSGSADPFVGTWRERLPDGTLAQTALAISAAGGRYTATFAGSGSEETRALPLPGQSLQLTRRDDELLGSSRAASLGSIGLTLACRRGTGRLYGTISSSSAMSGVLAFYPRTFVKVSQSTAYPATP